MTTATAFTPTVVADYPAYQIITADPAKEWKHGDIFALPRQTRNHGVLWYFYTLGSVASYAKQYREDPEDAVAQAVERGHKLYWANPNAVSITAWKRDKETREALEYDAVIQFEGNRFQLKKLGFEHVELVEVAK